MDSQALHQLLADHWGYTEFRPKQEAIISAILSGQDAAVVMPTGGGKSLCYQLPAVAMGKTAIVVSPLLSLMQDQVAQLRELGIPAAALNSTMNYGEQMQVMQQARRGMHRLLYVSPERLVREDTRLWLQSVPVSFFAIDEAHCISEWGHEFRPEYRELSHLRTAFPDCPIAAFTASATRRVRHDILAQLKLREPRTFISSFFRPNLRLTVRECKKADQEQLLLRTLEAHDGDNVIVYAPTIARVEEVADTLVSHGIPALPYHGKMQTEERRVNQERWMSDEVRVIVGTLAFGMGINKPGVRAVIHLSLPKSVEQLYQEVGRAGRDGLPADCVLLWRKQDAGLLAHFIEQIQDRRERESSWDRYHSIRHFAEDQVCRHRQLCLYFGETPKWEGCAACDVCAGAPDWLTAKKVRKRAERTKAKVVAATPKTSSPPNSIEGDPELLDYLREWRRKLAEVRGVPAFVILHDASLADLSRKKPRSLSELESVHGIGRGKAASLGEEILRSIAQYENGARAERAAPKMSAPLQQTRELLAQGMSFEQIAEARGRRVDTIVSQIADMVEDGTLELDDRWIRPGLVAAIQEQAKRVGFDRLRPIKEALPDDVSYPEIRLVVAGMRRRSQALGTSP